MFPPAEPKPKAATQAHPFNCALSLEIDRLIIALEAQPRQPRRAWLRLRLRLAERAIPVYLPEVKR